MTHVDWLENIDQQIYPIDLSNKSVGIYWLQLTIDGEVVNNKIVKSE